MYRIAGQTDNVQSSMQSWATIDPPEKRHSNGVSLGSRSWTAFVPLTGKGPGHCVTCVCDVESVPQDTTPLISLMEIFIR